MDNLPNLDHLKKSIKQAELWFNERRGLVVLWIYPDTLAIPIEGDNGVFKFKPMTRHQMHQMGYIYIGDL